jgi:alpha-D-xyloside xylohydrolase
VQFTGEKPADPIALYVYAGADGAFTLYEDDGLSYGYERGAFSQIPLRWTDSTHTLSLGARTGAYPGMPAERTFDLVLVSPSKPAGFPTGPSSGGQRIRYAGNPSDVVLR